MTPIIFNIPGIIMLAIAFAIALGITFAIGIVAEGPAMIIAGPLCVAMDLSYRHQYGGRKWFHPDFGGNLFFLPIWTFGILWFVLGIVYAIRGSG